MKMKELTPEIINIVKEEQTKGSSARGVHKKYKDIINGLTLRNVRDIFNGIAEKIIGLRSELKELNETIQEERHYELTEDFYIFYQKRKNAETGKMEVNKYPISIETVDAIFKDYSKHGYDLSGEEILQKYEIKIELFNIIKNRLRLFKSSHVVSPATMDRLSEDELQARIDGAIDEHIHDRYRTKFVKTFEKKKHEDYIKKSKVLSNLDYFLEHLQEFIKSYPVKDIEVVSSKTERTGSILVGTSDWHIGKKNSASVLDRISKMTQDLIMRPEQNIDILFGGDTPETLTRGGMHAGQLESMDGPFEFDLLMKCVEELETMLISLYSAGKTVRAYGVGGNHARFTKESKDSMQGIGDLVAYEMVNRSLSSIGLHINLLKETWNSFEFDGMNIIVAHGCNGATEKKPSQVLWEHGKQGMPNVIIFGDKHHSEQFDCHSDAIKLLLPSLAGKNVYDSNNLLASYPGYTIITKNSDGVPDTYTRRFKMDT